jgi:zinc ribbon protein
MALAKCPECGHDVSTRAKACPSCGAPGKPSGVRLGLFLVAVIGIAALIGLSVGDRSTTDQPPTPSSPVVTSTTSTPAPAPPTRTLIRRAPGICRNFSEETKEALL